MSRIRLMVALLLAWSFTACGGTMKQYASADVEILTVSQTTPGSTEIVYQPILETLYFCPGANVRSDAGRQKVSFVRCRIGDTCAVQAKAEKLSVGKWKIIVAAAPETIDFSFRDTEVNAGMKVK